MAAQSVPPKVYIDSQNLDLEENNTKEDETKPILVFKLTSLGKTIVDRRYTAQIIQWVVREISQAQKSSHISVNLYIKNNELKIETTEPSEEQLSKSYSFESILKLPRLKSQEKLLAFVSLDKTEPSQCCCHAFECQDNETVGI